ncbi:MAG: hypothetical protein LBM75_02550 [Myxococcales bacterium]|jgi:hypothetical protein|nr:hypothetical protein [Myxococcales bacterium]
MATSPGNGSKFSLHEAYCLPLLFSEWDSVSSVFGPNGIVEKCNRNTAGINSDDAWLDFFKTLSLPRGQLLGDRRKCLSLSAWPSKALQRVLA